MKEFSTVPWHESDRMGGNEKSRLGAHVAAMVMFICMSNVQEKNVFSLTFAGEVFFPK